MHKKHLTLFLPSLLTGCCAGFTSPPAPENAATALVFVDGQISESSTILAQTQRRLSPPPVSRPVPVTTPHAQAVAAQSLSLPAPALTVNATLSNIIMTGTPERAPVSALPLTRNRTVSDLVKQLLPAGWQFRQENAATPKLRTRIASWSANDQWTRSLNRLLAEQHLWGHLDWKNRTLTVTTSPAAPATDSSPQATAPASATSAVAASPVKTRPSPAPVSPFRNSTVAGKPSASHLKVSGQPGDITIVFLSEARNFTTEQWVNRLLPDGWKTDWRTDRQARQHRTARLAVNDQWTRALDALLTRQNLWGHLDWNSRTLVITPTADVPLRPATTPDRPAVARTTPTPSPVTYWTAEKGSTLHQTLALWTAKVPCTFAVQKPGQTWTLIWDTPVDYPVDAPLHFRGSFDAVLEDVLTLYLAADRPLYAFRNTSQCVIRITDSQQE
ncbi:hypothetical protein C9F78_004093 [Salmonella enterica subsp. enterica serovar 4,[5],12:b:-]|nr:hypothetical protein [Salmonella enterica subsp. enterica serovar 4,[5],12:b:-]